MYTAQSSQEDKNKTRRFMHHFIPDLCFAPRGNQASDDDDDDEDEKRDQGIELTL